CERTGQAAQTASAAWTSSGVQTSTTNTSEPAQAARSRHGDGSRSSAIPATASAPLGHVPGSGVCDARALLHLIGHPLGKPPVSPSVVDHHATRAVQHDREAVGENVSDSTAWLDVRE